MDDKPTMGELFAGIGGFSLGFERAGFEVCWQVEIEPFCRKVLARHFPNAERFEDVRRVGVSCLRGVDVICGGFPCQDISYAGKGAGITGERSGLWAEYARIIGELRPRFVVVENVPALLARGMGRVLGDLAALGYDAEWDRLSAAGMGAPHLRKRVWIVAYPKEERCGKARRFRSEQPTQRIPRCREALIFTDPREERAQRFIAETIQGIKGFSWCKDVGRIEDLLNRPDLPSPLFRGSIDGIPNWVDRIGACGNAVVPQISEWIANRIKPHLVQSS